jgi:hypothetical protein
LAVNAALATDTDVIGDDGAISITASSADPAAFTIGPGGVITPGGTTNAVITITGNTANNGTINVGGVPSGPALTFDGSYTVGTVPTDPRKINGNPNEDPDIVFKGPSVTLGPFTHNNDRVVFDTGTWTGSAAGTVKDHTLSHAPSPVFSTHALGSVFIEAGNTVTIDSDIYQDSEEVPPASARSLELAGETSPGVNDGGKLVAVAHIWYMGNPSAASPGLAGGFAAFNGELIFNAGSSLETLDFYNTPAQDHKVTIRGASGITASGNVWVNRTFQPEAPLELKVFTLTMTGGTDANRKLLTAEPGVKIGTLRTSGTARTVFNSDIIICGDVIIEPKTKLYGGLSANSNPNIYVEGYYGDSSSIKETRGANWYQWMPTSTPPVYASNDPNLNDHEGIFIPQQSYVELGKSALGPGRTFRITGNTDWWVLACREPLADILFSNYSHTHKVGKKFEIQPRDNSGPVTDEQMMIKVSRLIDVTGPYLTGPNPPGPQTPKTDDDTKPWISPITPNEGFWCFDLLPGAELRFDRVFLHYSFSQKRIPLPVSTGGLVVAAPYVYATVPPPPISYTYTLGDPRAGVEISIQRSFYNVNWFVANEFFYSFTEDSDGNGRIDRIRAQAAFELMDAGAGAFDLFDVEVDDGYTIDTSKGSRGYARADFDDLNNPAKMDCIFIFLKEKDYSDTGAALTWRITRNESLKDLTTKTILLGEAEPDKKPQTKTTIDTAPPRINYALTLPGAEDPTHGPAVFFQVSETVDTASIIVSGGAGKITSPTTLHQLDGKTEFLIPLDSSYSAVDLAGSSIPEFKAENVRDIAEFAQDLRFNPDIRYAYQYPSPKYPKDWDYSDYVEIRGWYDPSNSGDNFDFDAVPPNPANLPPIREWYRNDNVSPNANSSPNQGNKIYGAPFSLPNGEASHRVTDVLISVPPSSASDDRYFIWPVWARYSEHDPSYDNLDDFWGLNVPFNEGQFRRDRETDDGIIWEFNGKKFLEKRDTVLQWKLNGAVSANPSLVYAFSVPGSFRAIGRNNGTGHGNAGLWLPPSLTVPLYANLVPWYNGSFFEKSGTASGGSGLFTYEFKAGADGFESGAKLDFFFRLDTSPDDVFNGRLDISPGAPVPANWYRLVRPFSFDIHDITRQRSGVTITNNVINPSRGEKTYVHYQLPRSGRVTIQVFTLDGSMVKSLRRESRPAGEYTEAWDGTNNGGRAVARGMYFIRVVGPEIDEIRKVMVVR